jgi:hypothetical protein
VRNKLCSESAARVLRTKPEIITVVEDRAIDGAGPADGRSSGQVIGYYNFSPHGSRTELGKSISAVTIFNLEAEEPAPARFHRSLR